MLESGWPPEGLRRMDRFGVACGRANEMALGRSSSCDSSELVDPNGNTLILKRKYDDKEGEGDDFVDVDGPFPGMKREGKEDDHDHDHPEGVTSGDVIPTRIFEVKCVDDGPLVSDLSVATPELLVVWQQHQGRSSSDDIRNNNRESIWMRKEDDPQCEVWSCKMSATYGHSTGPSRCAQHREAWMVMFDHCIVAGCLKFGVVFSSEDEHVRCEAHAAEDRCRRSIQRLQARPLEHLVDDNSTGPAELGLGLGLGKDYGVHEGSTVVKQPQVVVEETSLRGTGEESCGQSGNAQEGQRGVAETSWALPPSNCCHPAVELNNAAPSNSVDNEIHRLKEEYEDLRQKMVKIEIELARLQGVQFREPQKNDAPVKRTLQGRHRQSSSAKVTNGWSNAVSTAAGNISLDGYNWRKYGELSIPGIGGSPNPRVFYGCTNIGCIARKIEERTGEGHVKHFYEGVHNHPQPGKNFTHPVLVPHWKRRKRHHNGFAH